ncbi:pyroglutamylated RFamide peptide receptor-like [Sinocyclocheilus grahami]|uniref:pyroglutamylated RFamide peptide receptor-like n=1 Tax=Sinocyclocheilus grahami TaxID=75366 RepID=UPI0007ACC8F2|nr:PREDICTED: pyroglutamylated RFamide peptide receptor-like [Sinocyclocheilus grahami]
MNVLDDMEERVLVCKTVPFVQTTAIVTGILTMTCIAIERYQGIVYPLKMKRQCTPKRAYKMLGLVWIAAVMVGSPMLFVQQLEANELEKNYDEVTVNMIIAVVQAIGFSNSFNNPIVYAFMNENFKKNCVATLSAYLRRPVQQSGAGQRPNLSVHFSKHLKTSGNNANLHTHQNRVLSSSHGDLEISTAFSEQKVKTANSQLPSSSSCVK